MHLAELLFFGCFTIFIIAILLLDTLVIDKKAHEVSMKEAGICCQQTDESPSNFIVRKIQQIGIGIP